MAPSYERPALVVPSHQGADVSTTPSVVLSEQNENELNKAEESLVTELSPGGELQRRVLLALKFNRDFQVAGLRVLETRVVLGIAQADRSPTVAAGFQRDRQQFDNAAANERFGQDLNVVSIGVSDFELDFFGRVQSLSEAARHDYLATTYGQQAARSALISEVVRSFLLEELTALLLDDAQRIDDTRKSLLEMAEHDRILGALSYDDVAVLKVNALRSHLQLEAAIADHARASEAHLLLTGYSAPVRQAQAKPVELASTDLNTPAWLVDMPSQRLLERFDVRQREETLKAANANIGAARAAFFPSIRLSTGVGIASEGLSNLFKAGSGAWLFSPQLTLPLFDGGRNRSNLNLAQVRKQIAVAQYEKTIQVAFREVADALIQRGQILDRVRSETEMRTLAQEKIYRLAAELEAGSADRHQFLASVIQIAQADMTWRKSRHDLLLNRLDFYRVLCGIDSTNTEFDPKTGASQ